MKILIPLLLALCLFSCKDKSYKYVEVVRVKGLMSNSLSTKDEDPEVIKAESDSAAYLEAYQKFCIAQKVNQDMTSTLGETSRVPVEFKLFDDKGADIANAVFFSNREEREQEIRKRIFSRENSVQRSMDNIKEEKKAEFAASKRIDSVKTKELSKHFRIRKDEFSNTGRTWYEPKSAPHYTNQNGLYCYFQAEDGMPGNLRIRLQYYSDDWLFFKKVQFSIDGKAYEYIPTDTETDSGDGGYIWEWFDEAVSQYDKDLINALANAKSAKMKLVGRQYYDTKTISQQQLTAIKRTIELYRAMGGDF